MASNTMPASDIRKQFNSQNKDIDSTAVSSQKDTATLFAPIAVISNKIATVLSSVNASALKVTQYAVSGGNIIQSHPTPPKNKNDIAATLEKRPDFREATKDTLMGTNKGEAPSNK